MPEFQLWRLENDCVGAAHVRDGLPTGEALRMDLSLPDTAASWPRGHEAASLHFDALLLA